MFQSGCAFCTLYEVNTRPHALHHCNELKRLNKWNAYVNFRNRIRYTKSKHRAVCFLCHVPQCSDKLHRTFKDKNQCDYPDIIALISFGVFEQTHLRIQAEQYFKVSWDKMQDYVDWINGQVIEGAQTICRKYFCGMYD
jgi:hypothetical protein